MRGIGAAVLLLAGCGAAGEGAPTVSATQANNAPAWLQAQINPRQPGPLAPRDDCRELPGAAEFRQALAIAVEQRNGAAIAGMAVPDIKLGFGGEDGSGRLRAELTRPETKAFADMREALALGCAVDEQGSLVMPWLFAQDPGEIDVFEAMLVTGSNVPLRAAPDASAKAVASLSWEWVSLTGSLEPERPFQQVRSDQGTNGFVETKRLRSAIDYRIFAERVNSQWKITAFLAGD